MTCPQCRKAELVTARENYNYLESGLRNVTLRDLTVRHCPECGARLASIPKMADLHRAIALALISKPERLVPSESRFLRKHLGWSGADFARKFHCSPSQVSRWESESSPAPMSNAYELLLRAAVALGEKVDDYSERMEEVATIDKASPAVLALVHEGKKWKQAA